MRPISIAALGLLMLGDRVAATPVPSTATSNTTAADVLNQTVIALGGQAALDSITNITYQCDTIFRSSTLTQNYNLFQSDQGVADMGTQNISFSFADGVLRQRIDRTYQYDRYWLWAFANLRPLMDWSLVVRDGPQPYACFNKGQNSFFADDPTKALGFADEYLTDYLIHAAQQLALPGLLRQFQLNTSSLVLSSTILTQSTQSYTSLLHPSLGLMLLVDEKTFLPYAVRSFEDHVVYGPSVSDMVFTNYTAILAPSSIRGDGDHSIYLPHRVQTVYNEATVLEDFVIDKITINPSFPADHFTPNPPPKPTSTKPNAPHTDTEYPRSEVHEFFEAGLWGGPFGDFFNVSDVVVAPMFPNGSVPQIMNLFVGYPDYVQLLVELDQGRLVITDAPAHRSKIILAWVAQNMPGKRVTHVVPSHHHRDHAGGVADYLAAGATLVIPDIALDFYRHTLDSSTTTGGGGNVVTYSRDAPFVLQDANVVFSSHFGNEMPHARDWTYAVAGPASSSSSLSSSSSPNNETEVVVFCADVVNPAAVDLPPAKWDMGAARDFLRSAMQNGVPRHATLLGSHGSSGLGLGTQDSIAHIVEMAGFVYPFES